MAKEKRKEIEIEFVEKMNELENSEKAEKIIQNNQIFFTLKKVKYKVRKATYSEQLEVEEFRRKEYLRLVQDDTYKFRKQWIEIYKNKGIDIEKKEKEISECQHEINTIMLKLAQTDNKTNVEKLKTEIYELRSKQAVVHMEKMDLLSYSIEDQLSLFVNSYYAYLVLETEIEKDKWVKVFTNYKGFKDSKDSDLITKTFYYVNFLIYRVEF